MKNKILMLVFIGAALTACQKEVVAPAGACQDQTAIDQYLSWDDSTLLQAASVDGGGGIGWCKIDDANSFTTMHYGIYVAGQSKPSFVSTSKAELVIELREYIKDCKCGL